MRNYLVNAFDKQEENLDIFEVKRLLMHHPEINMESPLEDTYLDVNINVIMDGAGLIKDNL